MSELVEKLEERASTLGDAARRLATVSPAACALLSEFASLDREAAAHLIKRKEAVRSSTSNARLKIARLFCRAADAPAASWRSFTPEADEVIDLVLEALQ